MEDFIVWLAEVTDPRQDNNRHHLHDVLTIALCGGERFLRQGQSLQQNRRDR